MGQFMSIVPQWADSTKGRGTELPLWWSGTVHINHSTKTLDLFIIEFQVATQFTANRSHLNGFSDFQLTIEFRS